MGRGGVGHRPAPACWVVVNWASLFRGPTSIYGTKALFSSP